MKRAGGWCMAWAGVLMVVCTAVAQQPQPAAQPQPAEAIFQQLDRNGDGKLTPQELSPRQRERFEQMDRDQDGAVSRQEYVAFVQRTAQQPGVPPRLAQDLRIELDIAYAGTDNPRQRLDVLLPKDAQPERPLPVVVFIHGGGWRGGDKRGGLNRLAPLVASGQYAGVSVGYRLTDEASWPAQIYDCKAAIRWIRTNAAKYGFDPQRIGVMGTSAGGHLVAMLGTSGGVKELEGDLGPHRDADSRVQCVVDFFGPADLLTMGSNTTAAPNSPVALLIGGSLQEKADVARQASPVTYVTPDDPPFLMIHGTEDRTVPYAQSEKLHAALLKAGVSSILLKVEGGGHGGFRNPEIERRVRAFFDKHLRGQAVEISGEALPASVEP
jgi:acetyl esterase/lipase